MIDYITGSKYYCPANPAYLIVIETATILGYFINISLTTFANLEKSEKRL